MNTQHNLSQIIPRDRVKTRAIDRIAYANDASYFRLVPQAVVQPNSISEIQVLFAFSQKSNIPMTFRAAGTSLSGQAITDGILVDISKHWGDYRVEEGGKLIRTQPGLVGGFANNVLKPYQRRIGPDPASIDACMIGGILANNSSGMCCGVTENSYKTIHSMTVVFTNGFVLDTSAADADEQFRAGAPEIYEGVIDLRRRVLGTQIKSNRQERHAGQVHQGDLNLGVFGSLGNLGGKNYESLAERIKEKYQMKNTNGYQLQALVDFESPLDILTHLMIGSEGTLGFIAEAVLHTLPEYTRKYTGMLYFKNIQDAASAIAPLKDSGARAAEIMDRHSLRSVESVPGAPAIIRDLPEGAAAILAEYQGSSAEDIQFFQKESDRVVKSLRLLAAPTFTDDPIQQAALWKPRKGIIASVGAMRPPGTTSVNEDVCFPVPRLAEAVTDLRHAFDDYGYSDGVLFGHAKDGNLHFLVNQAFDTDEQIQHFDKFIREIVKIVSGKYDGALKAEHGTGRNMAPFVATEWGDAAYAIMRDLKSLFDPSGLLNPGVMINTDPQAHVTHLKSLALVAPEVDKCIECGFCESKCPSRRLTLTPRQRIVVQREIARLKNLPQRHGDTKKNKSDLRGSAPLWQDEELLSDLQSSYLYDGIDTCAADGLCATACPVGINTGDYIKRRRADSVKSDKVANWVADNFGLVEKSLGAAVSIGHLIEPPRSPNSAMQGQQKSYLTSTTEAIEKITGNNLPKWNNSIPRPTKNLGDLRTLGALGGEKEFIYFPSCVSRQLGQPLSTSHALAETLIIIANRANIALAIPDDVEGICCGMPFASKGYTAAYQAILHKTLLKFWEWSEHGKYPVVIDTTSCAHTLRTCPDALDDEDKAIWDQLKILDSIEFIHDTLLPRLEIHPVDEDVVLHPNCSARKLGIDTKLVTIAQKCARSATVPLNLGCCAFAGDRGLLFPELTASATEKESAEVLAHAYDGYYSSNITCEMGMSEATGKNYVGIVYLVEKASW